MTDKDKDRPQRRAASDSSDSAEDDETELFRRAMADARPLQREFVEPVRRPVPAKARFTRKDERDVLDESLSPSPADTEFGSGDTLSFCRGDVGRRTFRKLGRGRFSVQAELDLHGMTVREARVALARFVDAALYHGHRCVRIIHGKGRGSGMAGPVLKGKVDAWLRRWDSVLAFVSAQPVDGGSGAIYVLLKSD